MPNHHTQSMHAGAKPEIFRFAEKLRANMTEPEKRLWELLKTKPLGSKFRRQHPFSTYVLDFYCHQAKLAIEIDGKYHDVPQQKELDDIRTEEIEELGIHEMRFSNEEVMEQFENVEQMILARLSLSR